MMFALLLLLSLLCCVVIECVTIVADMVCVIAVVVASINVAR